MAALGSGSVFVGLDVGGTKTNATVLDDGGNFLVDRMLETPSRVREGPDAALAAMRTSMDLALAAGGVISSRGATNFPEREWWGYDIRAAAEHHLHLPVIYNNDGNAAALYAHQ